MRTQVRQFIEKMAKHFEFKEPIVEIGSYQVNGIVDEDLRTILQIKKKKFIGCDMREGPGVDAVEDAHNLSFEDNTVGTVIILETLEHIKNPVKVLQEIYRVLKREGGMVIMTSCMNYPIHNHPSDYWRFTPAAFEFMLNDFDLVAVDYQGTKIFPHTIFGLGIKTTNPDYFEDYKDFRRRFEDATDYVQGF